MLVPMRLMSAGTLLVALLSVATGREIVVGGEQGWTLGLAYAPIGAATGDVLVSCFCEPISSVALAQNPNTDVGLLM